LHDIAANHSGLSLAQIEEIGFIYHYRGPNLRLFRDQIGCFEGFSLGGVLFSAGSGEWDIVNDTVVTGPEHHIEEVRFVSDALSRGLSHIAAEPGSADRYGLSYGGWMEIAWAETDTFRKLPYAAKYWTIMENGELFLHGPLVFSFYVGDDLFICRMLFDGAQHAPSTSFWRVPDPLGRTIASSKPNDVPFEPVFTAHHLSDKRTGEFGMIIRPPGEPSGIEMKMTNGKVSLRYTAELLNCVHDFKASSAPWAVGPNPAFSGSPHQNRNS
jgi:hypothetical protein